MAFERALETDPDSIDAKIGAALTCVIGILEGWSSSLRADQHLAEALLAEAIECEPNRPMAHHAMGMLRRSQKLLPDARASLERAIVLDPDDAGAVYQLGLALLYEGRPEAGIERIEEAIRISPRDRLLSSMYYGLGRCHLFLMNIDTALDCFDLTIGARPKYWDALLWRAGALGLTGDLARARAEYSAARLLRSEVNSLAKWRAYQPWITYPKYEALRDKTLYAGLRAAGMPDKSG